MEKIIYETTNQTTICEKRCNLKRKHVDVVKKFKPSKKQKIIVGEIFDGDEKPPYNPPILHHVPKNHFLYNEYSLYKKSNIKIWNDDGKNDDFAIQPYLDQNNQFNLFGILIIPYTL